MMMLVNKCNEVPRRMNAEQLNASCDMSSAFIAVSYNECNSKITMHNICAGICSDLLHTIHRRTLLCAPASM